MYRCNLAILLVFAALGGQSQRERVHLDLGKYSCRVGDTVYFKATIFKGPLPAAISTSIKTGENKNICLDEDG
jgi:hypothetical protein